MGFILVTGTGGVLGGRALKAFNARNLTAIPVSHDRTKWDANDWRQADVLVNFAFARSQDGAALASSLDFSRCLFEQAVMCGIPRIVNVSSQSVYGADRDHASRETDEASPMDMYAMAKYAAEGYLAQICRNSATTPVNLRLSSVFGVDYPERVVNKMARKALLEHRLDVQGGSQRFSFLSEDDAVEGVINVATLSTIPAGVYNLGTAESMSLSEIALVITQSVERTLGVKVEVHVTPSEGPVFRRLVDVEKLAKLGWRAKKTMPETIDEIVSAAHNGRFRAEVFS